MSKDNDIRRIVVAELAALNYKRAFRELLDAAVRERVDPEKLAQELKDALLGTRPVATPCRLCDEAMTHPIHQKGQISGHPFEPMWMTDPTALRDPPLLHDPDEELRTLHAFESGDIDPEHVSDGPICQRCDELHGHSLHQQQQAEPGEAIVAMNLSVGDRFVWGDHYEEVVEMTRHDKNGGKGKVTIVIHSGMNRTFPNDFEIFLAPSLARRNHTF